MKKIMLLALVLLGCFSTMAVAEEEWTVIPQGGKAAFMGIHGGTMPVSLLVSDDGSSLFTFVGRTGNDFMEVLRQAYAPLPSLGNSTSLLRPAPAAGELFAGNATTTMPVLPLSQDLNSALAQNLQPFGLSSEPLRIEGQVMKPASFPHAKSFRLFVWPDYLKPSR